MKIEEKVKQILAMLSGVETVGDEAVLQDDLALDSLLMVTMLIEIEDAFGITLDESDMNPFALTTVRDVTELVRKYTGGGEDNG